MKYIKRKQDLSKELEQAEEELSKARSSEDFREIVKKIDGLKYEIEGTEIEMRVHDRRKNEILKAEAPKVKDAYNREFQPHHDRYVELKKKLEKQLIRFVKATDQIVNEMIEIEKLETSFHMLKTMKYINDRNQFIELPVEKRSFTKKVYSPSAGNVYHCTTSELETILSAIKRNWRSNYGN